MRGSNREPEKRFHLGPVEFREAQEGTDTIGTIAGYAAVFGEVADLWGDGSYLEEIDPGAFDEALADPDLDTYAKVQHIGGLSVLGRIENKTLRLGVDNAGLWYEVDVPDTNAGRDIRTLTKRRDINRSSFAFTLRGDPEEAQQVSRPSPGVVHRKLLKVNLHDVSPVSEPAYEGTSVEARARTEEIVDELRIQLEETTVLEDEDAGRERQREADRLRLEEALTSVNLKSETPGV